MKSVLIIRQRSIDHAHKRLMLYGEYDMNNFNDKSESKIQQDNSEFNRHIQFKLIASTTLFIQ